jgi:hypothetical protein
MQADMVQLLTYVAPGYRNLFSPATQDTNAPRTTRRMLSNQSSDLDLDIRQTLFHVWYISRPQAPSAPMSTESDHTLQTLLAHEGL